MSDSKDPTPETGSGQNRIVNAIAGSLILLVIVILVNYVFGKFNPRMDLTDNKIYTLTDGTKSALDDLKKPVAIRFFAITDSDYVSQFYLSLARNVENFLAEYEKAGNGMITIKRLNPEPYSDDLELARFDGLEPGVFDDPDNPVFFGIAIECEDRKEILPFLPARPEGLLEDLTRSILRASDLTRKKVRIMTTMQVGGGMSAGFNAPPARAWYLIQSLRTDYDVEFLQATADVIPDDTDVLVILHPYDFGDEAQFAIDQYLLKGGRILATVDPNFYAAQFMQPANANPMMAQMGGGGGPAPSSSLDKLLSAWGVQYDASKVLADMTYQTRINSGFSPTVLSVGPKAMSKDDPVTSQLGDVFLITPGAFDITKKEGIQADALIESSPINQMISSFEADPTQRTVLDRLRRDFQPSNEKRVLVARLTGEFTTAFPDGKPGQASAEPGPGETEDGDAPTPPALEETEPEKADGEKKADAKADSDPKPAVDSKPAEEADKSDTKAEEASNSEADSKPKADTEKKAETADEAEVDREREEADGEPAPPAEVKTETETEAKPAEDAPALATEAESASSPAPSGGGSYLKKSEKEGLVVLFADMDFLYDQFCTRVGQNMQTGEVGLAPSNDNLAVFENALELAAGGADLSRVRSRATNRRPFDRLNEIESEVRSRFQGDVQKIESELQAIEADRGEVGQKILQIVAGNQENIESENVQRDLAEQVYKLQNQEEEMDEKVREWQEKRYDINKTIKQEFEREKNTIILLATGAVPALVAIFGIFQAITRRAKTAAR